jgi:hypothetical protein
MTIRTRFAPSPTGFLHVGGIRTALFAYLVARQAGGAFVLRLEDTDQKREVPGSREHLIASLKSLGLNYDEGPDVGGAYGPYVQSERLYIYKRWAEKLIDAGRAYADPYTPEEIQAFRDQAQAEKRAFLYRNHRPESPPKWDGMQPLRFKSEPKAYKWHDEVMGDLSTGPEVIDDIILIKSDGYPTYNFAHIVDDAEMQISHVIRGQEFISSMPNYLNLYEALGIEGMRVARGGAAPTETKSVDFDEDGADQVTGPADSDLRSVAYDGSGHCAIEGEPGAKPLSESTYAVSVQPSRKNELVKLLKYHLDLFDEWQPTLERPFETLKRFLKIYIRDFDGASDLRAAMMLSTSTDEVRELLNSHTPPIAP